MSKPIIQLNEETVKSELKEMVRNSVEETLNSLLNKEAEELTSAAKYERTESRQGYRSGHYSRKLTTTSGEVTLNIPKLKGIPFETAIIERYRRRESSVEEALIEMYLAGVSVRRVEDISEALWGMEQAAKQKKAVPAPSDTLDAPEIYRRNRNSVVELTADKGDCVGSGTGMVLPGGYVLTNAHVVFTKESATRVQAADSLIGVTADKRRMAFDIVYADVRRDMALIVSDDLAAPAITFADGDVTIGEKVYAIGNSKGQGICMLDGIVSDRERFISGERYIMYSAPTVGGNSGGPLFNAHGEVIGMVTLGQKDGSLMNYAIPTPVLKAFLREAEEKEGIVI